MNHVYVVYCAFFCFYVQHTDNTSKRIFEIIWLRRIKWSMIQCIFLWRENMEEQSTNDREEVVFKESWLLCWLLCWLLSRLILANLGKGFVCIRRFAWSCKVMKWEVFNMLIIPIDEFPHGNSSRNFKILYYTFIQIILFSSNIFDLNLVLLYLCLIYTHMY